MKMHYAISTNDDRVIINYLNAMMHAVEFQETFEWNALLSDVKLGKTCMDEKVIRFRKQNVGNSISYMHGICSLYLFSRTFFPQWRNVQLYGMLLNHEEV